MSPGPECWAPSLYTATYSQSVGKIMPGWPLLFDLNVAVADKDDLQVTVKGESGGAYFLTFRNCVIDVFQGDAEDADVELTMDKAVLSRLKTGEYGLSQARERGELQVSGSESVFRRLDELRL
jgi:alkyl sulfatase BDS1-like metallo-beta-lactamase superfamily hydrolase